MITPDSFRTYRTLLALRTPSDLRHRPLAPIVPNDLRHRPLDPVTPDSLKVICKIIIQFLTNKIE
jgi:hypothetical protein